MITTNSICLRPLEREDLPLRVKWLNDPEIYKTLLSDFPVSLAKTEAWFNKVLFDNTKVNFSIIHKETNKVIGMTGLLQVDVKHSNAQLYITIGESNFHGKRYPDEIIPAILEYSFFELNLNKIYLWTIPDNERGRAVYERNGFVKEAEMEQHMYCRGKYQTIIQHRVLKQEFSMRT